MIVISDDGRVLAGSCRAGDVKKFGLFKASAYEVVSGE